MFESVVVLGAEPVTGPAAGPVVGSIAGPGRSPESAGPAGGLTPAVLLTWAEAEPAGARSAALLDGVDPAGLDPGGQVRLPVAWARVEAHAAARRLAAVAAVAGPEPEHRGGAGRGLRQPGGRRGVASPAGRRYHTAPHDHRLGP